MKSVKIFGQTIKYNNISDLAKQLKVSNDAHTRKEITRATLTNIEKPKILYDTLSHNFEKINLKDRQSLVLLRNFTGKRRILKNEKDIIMQQNQNYIIDNKSILMIDETDKDTLNELILRYTFYLDIIFKFSDRIYIREISRYAYCKSYELERHIKDAAEHYADLIGGLDYGKNQDINNLEDDHYIYIIKKVDVNKLNFDIRTMRLKSIKPIDISVNIYNDIINIQDIKINCVHDYLIETYKKISKNSILQYGTKEGITTNELKHFCIKYNIKMIAYDITGKIIESHYPDKINGKSYKNLIYIAHNHHIYPLKNSKLNKKQVNVIEQKRFLTQESLNNKFNKILNKGIEPAQIKINNVKNNDNTITVNILSFVHKNKLYYYNVDYDNVEKLYKKFGLLDYLKENPLLNIHSCMKNIEKLYVKENINSYCPELKNIPKKGGYAYVDTKNDYDSKYVHTLDATKFYASCITQLPYLITVDTKSNNINEKKDTTNIIDHYLYVVQPINLNSFLIDKTTVVSGSYLKKILMIHEEHNINMLYEIETTKVDNYLKKMIEDIYSYTDLNIKFLKELINIYIGKLSNGNFEKKSMHVIENVVLNNECQYYDMDITRYNNQYSFLKSVKEDVSLYTRFPIHCQILDQSRIELLNLRTHLYNKGYNNIVQIKTDAISFFTKRLNKNDFIDILAKSDRDLTKWKFIKFEKMKCSTLCYESEEINIFDNTIINNKKNILIDAPAGSGKSHCIINNLIPSIKDNDYKVITPSNKALEEYRRNKYNSDVIQKYELNNIIPTEKTIIVDEIGMVGRKGLDILLKCAYFGKRIISYGDYSQLLPVDDNITKPYNNKQFIDFLYNKTDILDQNHRNHFTKEYYNKLRTNKNIKYLINECKKYSTKNYYDAEYIICFTNETKDKYNNMMLELLNKKINDIGVRVICKTNKLRDNNIYNNYILTIIGKEKDKIIFNDGSSVTEKDLNKYFKPAYALTLHCLQGASILSYYFAEEDINSITKFQNWNRYSYTLISRIKNKNLNDYEKIILQYNYKSILGKYQK